MSAMPMRVVIADDERLARERLRALLAEAGGVEVVAEARELRADDPAKKSILLPPTPVIDAPVMLMAALPSV